MLANKLGLNKENRRIRRRNLRAFKINLLELFIHYLIASVQSSPVQSSSVRWDSKNRLRRKRDISHGVKRILVDYLIGLNATKFEPQPQMGQNKYGRREDMLRPFEARVIDVNHEAIIILTGSQRG